MEWFRELLAERDERGAARRVAEDAEHSVRQDFAAVHGTLFGCGSAVGPISLPSSSIRRFTKSDSGVRFGKPRKSRGRSKGRNRPICPR